MSRRASLVRREPVESKSAQAEIPLAGERGYGDLAPWLLLFAGSGCAALIYEIVWFQLLQLVIGSSAVSLALLLAAYMGGLCLGSVAFARVVSARLHPMRVYAMLELGIAAFGMVALFGVPLVARIYIAGETSGLAGLVLRGAVSAVCLLPPTLLMGASLPAIARAAKTTPRGVSWLGLLYSANVAGAVVGCLFAGFYLLRLYDMAVATYTAAGLNLAVGGLALALARFRRYESEAREQSRHVQRAPGAWFIYTTIAFSGLTALGAEVVWTRLLSLLLGATVYTFSIILAVFLTGLWAGSGAGSFLVRRVRDPRWALAACQILLAAAIAWTAFTVAYVLPRWPVDPWLAINPWIGFDLDLTRCIRAIFPATLLWGASFPLALAAAAATKEDPARLTGEVYAANTGGAIAGALAFSLLLIPIMGTQRSQQVLIWLAAAAAMVAVAPVFFRPSGFRALRFAGLLAGAAALAWGMSATVATVPWQVIAHGRRVAPILRGLDRASDAETKPLFVGEGLNSSVVITQRENQRFFYVSGKSEASSAPLDMRLQRMMGHLPALLHPASPSWAEPRSVLVVGFGAGVTAGSFVPYPEVRNIVICELERLIPPASDEYFGKENNHVLRDPRARVVYDDARHYILITPEKFDVITTDPIHPWVKGTSTLYSKEYYELIKRRLNPGGIAAQWLPIYESDEQTVKTELATFFSVFPNATVWSNYLDGDGYDLVLLGSADPSAIRVEEVQRRLDQAGYSGVSRSLAETGFHSAVDLLATYVGRAPDLAPMWHEVPINTDLNMRLQYVAGLGLNSIDSARIYREILSYRKFPEDLLTGSGEGVARLRELIGRARRTF
jgi:spermidine synthase